MQFLKIFYIINENKMIQSKKLLGVVKLLEVLKRAISIFDALIIAAAAFLFSKMDYENLTTFNKIYIVVFVLWVLMLLIRIYIIYKNGEGKNE